jgi:chromosome segregation ATPase
MSRKSEDVSKELILWNDNRAKCLEEIARYEREKMVTEQKIETSRRRLETCEENIQLIKTVLRDVLLQECPECQPTITNAQNAEQKPQSSNPSQITAQNPDGQLVHTTVPWSESSV